VKVLFLVLKNIYINHTIKMVIKNMI
jgi:hypothetical protein